MGADVEDEDGQVTQPVPGLAAAVRLTFAAEVIPAQPEPEPEPDEDEESQP